MAKTANRRVNIFLNGKAIEGTVKSLKKEFRKLHREIDLAETPEDYARMAKRIKELDGQIKSHKNNLRGVAIGYKKVTLGLGKFLAVAGIAFGAREIIGYGKRVLDLGISMDTLNRKAQTVFGEALPLVTREAEKNATAMGLTTSQYTDAATAIADLLIPMGFQREESAAISTELVNLSGALSEWTGGQKSATEVSEILQKALLGEREQLKTLGISIQEADVKARLAEKGLEKLTGTMLQQAKAAATLELITEKTADAQATFANGQGTAIRNIAELTARLTELSERIATLLLPIFGKLIGVVNSFVGAIGDYLDTPIEEKIKGEQQELNVLVNSITETNLSQEKRNALIGELQAKYPAFLKGLNAEKVTNEELGKRLSEVNNQYILKIALTKEDAAVQQKANDIADNERGIAEQRVKALQLATELNLKYKLGLDLSNKSLETAVQLTKDAVDARDDVRINSATRAQLNLNTSRIEGVKTQKSELVALEERRKLIEANIKAQLGISDVNFIDGSGEGETDINSDPEINYEKLKQAKLLKLAKTGNDNQRTLATAELERRNKIAEAQRKEREKEADRELKALEKQQARLIETVKKFQEEDRINDLSDDDQKIERLRLRYQKEIDAAKELEAQGVKGATEQRKQLESLRDQEVGQLRDELLAARTEEEKKKAVESLKEINDAKLEEEERQRQEKLQIQAFLDESNLNARQLELIKLEEDFYAVADLTGDNDDKLLELLKAYRLKKKEINDKFDKSDRADYIKSQNAQAEALAVSFKSASQIIGGIMDAIGEKASESTALGKALTLAQIGLDTASAISSLTKYSEANPANAVTFGAAGIAQFTSGLVRILANIGQARKLLNSTKTPQKKEGGWQNIIGQDDNVSYRAKYIGSPSSGMLPSHPVVLASETGPEYFVSNKALQNPYVLDHVRAIDNITKMRQFRDGGATETLPTTTTPAETRTNASDIVNSALATELNRLNNNLERGIVALIDDDTVVDTFKKFNQLNSSAGGVLIQ